MIVRDLVSKISGVDYLMIYKNDEFSCYISKEDLDKDLPILDSEVCSVEVVIYDGWCDIDKKLLNLKVLKYEFDIEVWLSGYRGGHYQILVIEVE